MNHFIEIGYDSNDKIWIVVHSGSRNFGHSVATHWMKLASGSNKAKEGHYGIDSKSKDGIEYICDASFCQEYAKENREQLTQQVVKIIDNITCKNHHKDPVTGIYQDLTDRVNKNHNFLEKKDGLIIHRKGATDASKGILGIVPGNMRDGTFIVEGRGNLSSINSCSHGAGRAMSRTQAKKVLSLNDFSREMSTIKAKVDSTTLDESPEAYKSINKVMEDQQELVKIINHITPLINIKG